jgi:hypothetical protein
VKLFGQRGAARVQREKAEVLAVIEAAFNGIDFPGPEHMSLYQAEAEDTYDSCDQSRDHKGRWQDLPRTHILECQWALSYLGKPSLPYYLPAIMSFVVREYDLDADDHKSRWIFHSMECHLRFDKPEPSKASGSKNATAGSPRPSSARSLASPNTIGVATQIANDGT